MMKKRKADPWFPFWIDKWLFGSTRIELEPDERGVFVDLMAFSKKDDGYIRANEGVPYLEIQLCGYFNITAELLNRTIEKCIKYKKAKRLKDGTIYMLSHDVYKLSPRQERRIETEMSEIEDIVSKKPDAKKKNILDNNKEDNNKEKGLKSNLTDKQTTEIVKELITVKGISLQKAGLLVCYIKELSIEFPDLDYVYQMKKKVAWWKDNPLNKKSNIHLQIRNWFIIAQKGFTEARKQQQVGKDTGSKKTKYPTEFLNKVFILLRKQGKDNAEYSKKLFDIDYYQARQLAIKYNDNPEEFIKFLEEEK